MTPEELFHTSMEAVRGTPFRDRPGDPRPSGYYGALLVANGDERAEEQRRLGYYRDVFRVARLVPVGLDLLEAGSGFGLGLVSLACLGAGSVTGIELVDWQVEWARAYLRRLPAEVSSRITVHTGNVCAMPVADGTVDVVLSLEAISHYLDYHPFLDEAHRVLRPGGALIVSDGNNGRNRRIVRATEAVWAGHELDPRLRRPGTDAQSGDYDPWLLVDHRRRIVLETAPGLGEDESYALALNTSGMVRAEIVAAVERYVATGERPDRPYRGGPTVHPDQQIALERLFDPYELADEIAERGFRVSVRGHWGGASSRGVQIANDVLARGGRLTMRTARGFRLVATKR